MYTPTVSVIIPHYNSPVFLARAINSVPDNDHIEVIVIDNSKEPVSKDDIKGVMRPYRLEYSPYGKGAGCARNKGLDTAIGKYVIFMDADDMLTADASAIIDEYLADSHKADITYFRTSSIYNGSMRPASRADLYNKHLDNYINAPTETNLDRLRFYHLTPWAKIYTREVIDRSGARFDEVPASNDLYFCTSVAIAAKNIKADTRTLYTVTLQESGGTLTTTPNRRNTRSRHSVLLRQSRLFKKIGKIQYSSMPTVMLKTLLKISFGDFCWGITEIARQKVNPLAIAYKKIKLKEYK